jgi:3-deoxy-D-manno-octulosonic-acid transferase
MRLLYNILFPVGFVLMLPIYLLHLLRRGNWQQGFWQRFGCYDSNLQQQLTNRHVIWLHAVSVGEVNLLAHLFRELEHRLPQMKFVASATTSTGMAELRRRLPASVSKVYYPVDFRGSVRRALRYLAPRTVVLIEAEIWPNFLWTLRDRRTPVFLVNARLSERSFRRYRRFPRVFGPIFRAFAGVGAANEADAARLRELGCRPECVQVVGNMKFDAAPEDRTRTPLNVPALLSKLHVPADAPVIVAGSTHAGEEAILAEVCRNLRKKHPQLFLILVPRHQERTREVIRDLDKLGVNYALRSEVPGMGDGDGHGCECLVVNTTGELRFFYTAATAVFVGKSLTAEGGQNPIEPGALGKPILFGPNMQNFKSISEELVAKNGALRVHNAAELEQQFEALLSDPARRTEMGRNAQEIIRQNQGALHLTVEMILHELHERGEFVAGRADLVTPAKR